MSNINKIYSEFGLTPEQVKNLADHRGVRSWAFEPCLEFHNDRANEILASLLDILRAEWLRGYKRKPSPKKQCDFMSCLRSFMVNLIRVYISDPGLTVGIPRQKERLSNEGQYRPEFMSAHYYLKALDLLVDNNFIQVVKRGHRQEDYGETTRYALSENVLERLPVDEIRADDFSVGQRDELVFLKDTKRNLVKYDHMPETKVMHDNLRKLNKLLAGADISGTLPANRHADLEDDFRGYATDLYRVFNNGSFEQGGRFYGGWWLSAKKHYRRRIKINGDATIEADFKGLHPAILFAQNDLEIPADPYALIPGVAENPALRDPAKITFLALMNAGSRGTREPKDFDEQAHGITTGEFRRLVRGSFPMLPGIFNSGRGLFLQRADSDLAEEIMLYFVDKNIPILPIHDSFIVAEQHCDELLQVMKSTFHKAYGQTPTVTVT